MTDLATRQDADAPDADATGDHASDAPPPTYAWAPEQPRRKRRNLSALWIGLPVGATAIALVASSFVLIAPGAAVAGVPVGGLTPGAAADAIAARLATTTVVVNGPEGEFSVTGAELGATVDAAALAEAAFEQNPMWNPSSWFPGEVPAAVSFDAASAAEVLRASAPGLHVEPVDAQVAFDPATSSYAVTPAMPGEGLDPAPVQAALQDAFNAGLPSTSIDAAVVAVDPPITTAKADAMAATLNGMLDTVGFYVGEERTVPVDREVAASWLTVAAENGELVVTADPALIQHTVDTLPAVVNREAVDATVVTDTAGNVLREVVAGVTGRALESTDGIAAQFAAQLGEGNAAYALNVTETPFATTTLARRIEVNLSTQRTYLYENDQVVQSWAISSGLPATPTFTGRYKIGWKTPMQNMGCFPGAPYCTENVPWVAYFNGDQAFHGAYWHNNFGNPMSHGCINLPISAAKYLYDWSPQGTEVWIHY